MFSHKHKDLLWCQAQLLEEVVPLHENHCDKRKCIPDVKVLWIVIRVESFGYDNSDQNKHNHQGDRGTQDAKPQGAQKHVNEHPYV